MQITSEDLYAIEPGINYEQDNSFIIVMNVEPRITNTDLFGVYIKTGEDFADAIVTRIYFLDEKSSAQSFYFGVADI